MYPFALFPPPPFPALSHLSLPRNHVTLLSGENGSGKSAALQAPQVRWRLCGVQRPTAGVVCLALPLAHAAVHAAAHTLVTVHTTVHTFTP